MRWFSNSINTVYQQIIYKYIMHSLSQTKKYNISEQILNYVIVSFFISMCLNLYWKRKKLVSTSLELNEQKKTYLNHTFNKKLKIIKYFFSNQCFVVNLHPLLIMEKNMNKLKSHKQKITAAFWFLQWWHSMGCHSI